MIYKQNIKQYLDENTTVIFDRDALSAAKLTRIFCFLDCKETYCGAPDDLEF